VAKKNASLLDGVDAVDSLGIAGKRRRILARSGSNPIAMEREMELGRLFDQQVVEIA
jgi:hypothetical protein